MFVPAASPLRVGTGDHGSERIDQVNRAALRDGLLTKEGDDSRAGRINFSACDANRDGTTNVVDVQLSVNQVLGLAACSADINLDGQCNVVDVQRIVNASLGGACVSP